jgi:hypothetical protein
MVCSVCQRESLNGPIRHSAEVLWESYLKMLLKAARGELEEDRSASGDPGIEALLEILAGDDP